MFLLLFPFSAKSQTTRFENDTLFLSNGWKITEDQRLKIGTGSTPDGDFKYIRISATSMFSFTGTNKAAVNSANALPRSCSGLEYKVVRIDKRGTKRTGYNYYPIIGGGGVRYEVDTENAIRTGELVVPNEYVKSDSSKSSVGISIADELKKLKELLESGVLSKEEFDAAKKKLLGQ